MIPNPYSGKFIVFEGAEGSGKSTQAPILAERIQKEGYPVLLTKEPTEDGIFGKLVRFIYGCLSRYEELPKELERCINGREYTLIKELSGAVSKLHLDRFEEIAREIQMGNHARLPILIQLGMTFDGLDHVVREVIPALGGGIHVVSDRWRLSTPAYAAGDGLNWRDFFKLQFDVLGEHFIAPDLLILLDVPVETGLHRTLEKQKGEKNYFDDKERQKKIRRAYRKMIWDEEIRNYIRIANIDGTGDPESVHKTIWRTVKLILPRK